MVVFCRRFADHEVERRSLPFVDTPDSVRVSAELLNILSQIILTSPL